MKIEEPNKSKGIQSTMTKSPVVFEFLDFRQYLKAFYEYKKKVDRSFSYSAFAKRSNLKSPNYLKRVIDGDRPLSAEIIPKFCIGLNLQAEESVYFEALVNFNQTSDQDNKNHYFNILRQITKEKNGTALELVGAQVDVLKYWHVLAVRELVLFEDFQEDPAFIAKKLKNKVTKQEAAFALKALIEAQLLVRDPQTGKLVQAQELVRYSQDAVNMTVRSFHKQMLVRTGVALDEDEYGTWNARALTLAIPKEKFQEVYEKTSDFIYMMNKLYSFDLEEQMPDLLVQLNCQLVQISGVEQPPKFKKENLKNK